MKKSFLIILLSTFIFVVRLSAQNLMKFELHEDGYWITDFGTIGSTLEIPAYYNNQKVVQSQVYRPAGDENCKTIIFSEGMETWCDQMDFSKSFQNVEKIVIPSTMKHIGGESGYSIFHNKPNLREIDVSHKNEIIDGIFSRWVKVQTCNGARDRNGNPIKKHTEGWCFGGYLKRNTFYKN